MPKHATVSPIPYRTINKIEDNDTQRFIVLAQTLDIFFIQRKINSATSLQYRSALFSLAMTHALETEKWGSIQLSTYGQLGQHQVNA